MSYMQCKNGKNVLSFLYWFIKFEKKWKEKMSFRIFCKNEHVLHFKSMLFKNYCFLTMFFENFNVSNMTNFKVDLKHKNNNCINMNNYLNFPFQKHIFNWFYVLCIIVFLTKSINSGCFLNCLKKEWYYKPPHFLV